MQAVNVALLFPQRAGQPSGIQAGLAGVPSSRNFLTLARGLAAGGEP